MTESEARGWAAQAWREAEACQVMRDAFEADPGFFQGYVANVAMLLHDRYGLTDISVRNAAAREILWLIFQDDEK